MSILITGINGFVGKNLSQYLQLNHLEFKELNLRSQPEENISDGVTTIIHLAGKAHDLKKSSVPKDYFDANFELTKKLYISFLNSNAEKFIFISSVKAAADQVRGVLTEDVVPSPQTHYGKSKLLAEQFIQDQQLPSWKSYYILRPCMIHGPGNKGNLNLLYQFIKKGIPYPLAAFHNKRSFLSIENLCYIIKELALRNGVKSGIYQIADEEALSTNEVLTIISNSLDIKLRLWKLSPFIIKLLAKVGDWIHLPLTTERLSKLTESYIVSNYKVKQALKAQMPLTAVEGLRITAKAFIKA
ncbi:MAG: NAD-dependent epimerase/dehydratase family protein [Janthinobacterium lividum]